MTMTRPAMQGDREPPLMRRDHHGQRQYQQWWGVIVSKEELPLARGSPQQRWGATASGGDWQGWAITDEERPLLAMTNSNWWGGSTTDSDAGLSQVIFVISHAHKFIGLNRFKQVHIVLHLPEPWTELSVQFGKTFELWTELRSSSERFRFELRSRTELWQH